MQAMQRNQAGSGVLPKSAGIHCVLPSLLPGLVPSAGRKRIFQGATTEASGIARGETAYPVYALRASYFRYMEQHQETKHPGTRDNRHYPRVASGTGYRLLPDPLSRTGQQPTSVSAVNRPNRREGRVSTIKRADRVVNRELCTQRIYG